MKNKSDLFKDRLKNSANKKYTCHYVNIDVIRLDGGTQPRVKMDKTIIEEYTEAMKLGDKFPPLIIFKDEENILWLADGFHRYFAYKNCGIQSIPCEIIKGTLREAVLYSVGANATHGLRRTNEDKRKAVITLLKDEEWKKYSARKIGDIAGVDHKTVGNIKQELGLDTSNIIGRDGKEYFIKNPGGEFPHVDKSRKRFYRFKMEEEYKNEMKNIIKESKLNEAALLKEAFEYLQDKYLNK